MTARAVHWHEGMFLRPHHFQAARRHEEHLARRGAKWDVHYNWGLRSIDLDLDALANHRFAIAGLEARLRDGSLVAVPEDGLLPALDLKPALEQGRGVTVFLGVPAVHLGKANASAEPSVDGVRYRLDTLELEDENTGVNPQPIRVRLLNVRLLLSTMDHTGYEVLPIARIEKSPRAEAAPELAASFIPPLLACDAWKPLASGVLQTLYDRIGKKSEVLAGQVTTRGLSFDSRAQGELLLVEQLRELNEAYALLGVLTFAQGVHPLTAYVELCRLVGRLSIFHPRRRPPDLPRYDHDDLGGCFYRVKQYLDELLDLLVEPAYKERPFVGAGLRMQVALEPAWVEAAWEMFLGVQSPLPADECVRLLSRGQLDMKVGSSDRVDTVFRLGQAGLRVDHRPVVPRVLPDVPGQTYFQLGRDASQLEWQNVQRSLTLALRLNENRIVGDIQGQRTLTIRTGTQTVPMQFTLYVVPQTA